MEKTRYTFWVNIKLWKDFQAICIINSQQKNLVLQSLIKKYNEENKASLSKINI